jgi:hypothetical protein
MCRGAEIRAKLESGDLDLLGRVGRPLDTPSKTVDLFFQFENPVKLSEVCSKYEQLGQLVGVTISLRRFMKSIWLSYLSRPVLRSGLAGGILKVHGIKIAAIITTIQESLSTYSCTEEYCIC